MWNFIHQSAKKNYKHTILYKEFNSIFFLNFNSPLLVLSSTSSVVAWYYAQFKDVTVSHEYVNVTYLLTYLLTC